jgi:poly-gamma-glutamate capsule biosynthesis protein CapA/YwtB (metallophosphatase superfamily)
MATIDWDSGTWADGTPGEPEARVLVAADWAPYRATYEALLAADPEAAYGDLLPEIRRADLRIANVECALTDRGAPILKGGPNIKGAPDTVRALTLVPFDVACLANNHTCDYGGEGLRQTLKVLDDAGIQHVGAGMAQPQAEEPLAVDLGGMKLVIVNFCEGEDCTSANDSHGTCGWDTDRTARTVERCRASADLILVIAHAGREHTPLPPPYIVDAYRRIADAGADAVVAHHPHVPQGIEIRNGVPILYSLGNFVFFQEPELFYRRCGFIVELGVRGGRITGFRLIPYRITPGGLRLMGGGEAGNLFGRLRRASEPLGDDAAIRDCWDAFIDHLGADQLPGELRYFLNQFEQDPALGAAKARNVFITPAHCHLWTDATTRLVEGRMGTAPGWAAELVREWMTEPLPPDAK